MKKANTETTFIKPAEVKLKDYAKLEKIYIDESLSNLISLNTGTYLRVALLIGIKGEIINFKKPLYNEKTNPLFYQEFETYSDKDLTKKTKFTLIFQEIEALQWTYINSLNIEDMSGGAIIGELVLSGDLITLAQKFFLFQINLSTIKSELLKSEYGTFAATLTSLKLNFGWKVSIENQKVNWSKMPVKLYMDNNEWINCILLNLPSISFSNLFGVTITLKFSNLSNMGGKMQFTGGSDANSYTFYPHQLINSLLITNEEQIKELISSSFLNEIAKASGFNNGVNEMLTNEKAQKNEIGVSELLSSSFISNTSGVGNKESKDLISKIINSKVVQEQLSKIFEKLNPIIDKFMGNVSQNLPSPPQVQSSVINDTEDPQKIFEEIKEYKENLNKFLENFKIEIEWQDINLVKKMILQNIKRENPNNKEAINFIFDGYEKKIYNLQKLFYKKISELDKEKAESTFVSDIVNSFEDFLNSVVAELPNYLCSLNSKTFNQKFQIINDKKDDKIVYKIALLPLQFEEENISKNISSSQKIRVYSVGYDGGRWVNSIKFDMENVAKYFESALINISSPFGNKIFMYNPEEEVYTEVDNVELEKGGFRAFFALNNSVANAPLIKAEMQILGDLKFLSILKESDYSAYKTIIFLDVILRDTENRKNEQNLFKGYYYVTKVKHQIAFNEFYTTLTLLSANF